MRLQKFNLLLGLVFCLIATTSGCAKKKTTPAATPTTTHLLKGFGVSPLGFPLDYSLLSDFLTEVGNFSNGAVMWNGGWRNDLVGGTDAGTIPSAAVTFQVSGATYHYTPISVFGWRSGTTLYLDLPSHPTNNWTNTDTKTAFTTMLVDFATTYHPSYMFLGNENDFYFEQDSADYANWISFYESAYDAIKAVSPNTKVGPVFNVEHTAGTGTSAGWTTSQWGAVTAHDFNKVDVVALTVYPWLNYDSASSVPSTYLDAMISHLEGKPFGITETGWPAENLGSLNPSWETSSTAQETYIEKLGDALNGKTVEFVNWLYLYPMVDPGSSPTTWKEFGSISIKDGSGNERSAYDAWINFEL